MGPNTSLITRQGGRLWHCVCVFCAVSSAFPYTARVTNATVRHDSKPVHRLNCLSSSRPDGLDFLDITRALQFNPRAAQGLETSTQTSSSYLAIRTLEADLQPLNLGLNSASRTLEAPHGNRHASAWGMLVMMIISNRPTGGVYKRNYSFRINIMEEIYQIRSCIEILMNDWLSNYTI